ncbi:hypothetical protein BpHYR1_052729 [Brachionus plicatilis]|uniref:Uncharacterized protein n=1 Tax=Brachionus plicatilis TaxID=10195 RepID=A0A3M7SK29_BRAPC|nr:hypothetical protein BpHYR1_052729 [Brachionus plicatilis]
MLRTAKAPKLSIYHNSQPSAQRLAFGHTMRTKNIFPKDPSDLGIHARRGLIQTNNTRISQNSNCCGQFSFVAA